MGLVVLGVDVVVLGSCLSDYWVFWISGILVVVVVVFLWEGRDRRGRRKESLDEEGWVCGVFIGWNCLFLYGFV